MTRAFWLWMLVVVGAHFLIFPFSHGPLAGLLGVPMGVGTWMLLLTYR